MRGSGLLSNLPLRAHRATMRHALAIDAASQTSTLMKSASAMNTAEAAVVLQALRGLQTTYAALRSLN